MSTSRSEIIINQRTCCAVCGNRTLEKALRLPSLPLTGLFSRVANSGPVERFDQCLLVCPDCGHGQLEYQVNPAELYGNEYYFRTSVSAVATAGTDFFLKLFDDLAPNHNFECALDLGCNDLHLLRKLSGRAKIKVGIDPIWKGRENQTGDPSIQVIGSTIEELDLRQSLPKPPDLILCSHTLEHIYDPLSLLQQLMDSAADDALFLFEVPGFDALLRNYRFDLVFHQHLQYFNLTSFNRLLDRVGAEYLASRENHSHWWGPLLIAFRKMNRGRNVKAERSSSPFTIADLHSRYATFRHQMTATREVLDAFEERPLYGYGASQMLPTLAYHLESDLSILEAILDDDPAKQGLYYQNLPLKIMSTSSVADWSKVSVFITAVGNEKPILTRLLTGTRPKHILYPFQIF